MSKINIGRISGASGIKGEVKLYHYSGNSERLQVLTSLYLVFEGNETEYFIENFRIQKRTPIIKFENVSDRNTAESLVGADVFAEKELLRPTGEDEYFVDDLIGLDVIENGIKIGKVKSVIDNPAHGIVEIETQNAPILLPLIDKFIKNINIESSEITVELPDGLVDGMSNL